MKKGGLLLLLALVTQLANCTGELPISDLINNTITLRVLGTYESNDPVSDAAVSLRKDDVIKAAVGIDTTTWTTGSQIFTYADTLVTASRLKYYIDIAEIRLARGQGKSSSQSISDYWSQFAIDRQLMCSDYSSSDPNRTLSNCAEQNGVQRLYDFFNGGFTYPAVDVPSGTFNHMGIYFRRFNTYPAAVFNAAGKFSDLSGNDTTQDAAEQSVTSTFDNRTIYGLDIESFLQNQYGETATEPRMFPLQNKNLSLLIQDDHEPYVMEVRIFLKNLMMVHVRQSTAGTNTAGAVYVAPADWNINHAFTDVDNSGKMGGSVIMTARVYQPAKVGSITMSAPVATAGYYYAVMPAGTAFTTPATVLPLAAIPATSTVITNLQPGTYDVYRTCDLKYCSNSTQGSCDETAGANKDGFPETVSLCTGGPYVVTAGTTTPVTTGNCATSCP